MAKLYIPTSKLIIDVTLDNSSRSDSNFRAHSDNLGGMAVAKMRGRTHTYCSDIRSIMVFWCTVGYSTFLKYNPRQN